jgi:hypothetical protein
MGDHFPSGQFPDGHFPDGHFPEAESGAGTTPTGRKKYAIRTQVLRGQPVSRSNDVSDGFLFEAIVKDPGTTRLVELDLYEIAAAKWPANEIVAPNEFCRPRIPNGFSFEATTGGTTSSREPRWPATLGATVRDGECTWVCRASGSNGINLVSAPSASSDPTGLTITDIAIVENCKISATYAGGLDGQDYEAVFTWTLEAVTWIGRQLIRVRKQ